MPERQSGTGPGSEQAADIPDLAAAARSSGYPAVDVGAFKVPASDSISRVSTGRE